MAKGDNTAEITIKVSEEQKNLYGKLRDSYNSIDSKGAFKGERGAAAKTKISSNLSSIESALNKGTLTKEEQKILSSAFIDVAKTLRDFATRIAALSPKAKELQNSIEEIEKKISGYQEKRDLAGQNKLKTLNDFNNLKDLSIVYNKKDGTPGKKQASKANFLENYAADGDTSKYSFYYQNQLTQFNDLPEKIKNTIQYYLNLLKSIKTLADKLEKYEQELKGKNDELKSEVSQNPIGDAQEVLTADSNLSEAYSVKGQSNFKLENAEISEATKEVSLNLQKQQSVLGKAFKQFTIYQTVLRTVKTALREAAQTIVSLDKSLTEQAMVTGKTREQTYKLLSSYQNLASQTGATTKEIAESASEFMKQGKSISDSLTLSQAAVEAAKVAGVSVSESINYLTTALNGFKLSAEDAISVSDKFAAVAASSASDYDEIAIALSKVASQANLAGMSIDYTTALLTTGLEVTREAPETMGTALKTIIARMREISDYGETLEDGTDLNNVETQLKYIGIQLTNNSGELRSTEDVLDELGQKWDTLSSNQQAAVAKALAGTRQQSRLIAMMDNYDRVLELQEVSERSSGATAAQLDKYLQGMEASINRVKVAWEKVVTTFTNSDFLIGLVDSAAKLLDYVNDLSNTWGGQVLIYGTLVTMAASLLAKKQLENNIAKQQYQLQQQQQIEALETSQKEIEQEQIQQAQQEVTSAQQNLEIANQNLLVKEKETEEASNEVLLAQEKQLNAEAKKRAAEETKAYWAKQGKQSPAANADYAAAVKEEEEASAELAKAQTNLTKSQKSLAAAKANVTKASKKLSAAESNLSTTTTNVKNNLLQTNAQYKLQNDQLTLLKSNNLLAATSVLQLVSAQNLEKALELILYPIMLIRVKLLKKHTAAKIADTAATSSATEAAGKEAVADTAEAAAKQNATIKTIAHTAAIKAETAAMNTNPIFLAITAIALLTAGGIALTAWLTNLPSTTEQAADTIGTLTNEIYELNQANTAIETGISAWEEYDEKLIKTKEDADSLSESLSSVTDSLTDEQKEMYENATSDKQKAQLLYSFKSQNKSEIASKWSEAMSTFASLSSSDQATMLRDLSSFSSSESELQSQAATIQSAITAKNNQDLYDTIDSLTGLDDDYKDSIEDLTQSILENMSASEQWQWQQSKSVKSFISSISENKTALEAFTNFQNSELSLKSRLSAYEDICESLKGQTAALKSFQDLYSQYEIYKVMGDDVLSLIEDLNISDTTMNTLYTYYKTLNKEGIDISKEEYQSRFSTMLETFYETKDVSETIRSTFGDIVDLADDEAWNALVGIFDNLEESILNIGQNIDSFKNKISAFYEKASGWSDLTESERTEFLNDNAELFKGTQGQALYQAFVNQDYEAIKEALANNDALKEIYDARLQEIETAIAVEEAKIGDEYNAAYVEQLKSYKKYLEDTDNLFAASISTRLEQENNMIEEFKSLLEDEEDAIKDSLEKRKDAYNDYFDAVNDAADDEDYEEDAQTYINNLSKIGASTDANSMSQKKELENKLEDLEEERLKTLRENAQDAIISNIEDEIDSIGDKFDDLLDNSNQILQLMNQSLNSDGASFFSRLISNKSYEGGVTATGLQNYLQELTSTYGTKLNGIDLSDIEVTQDNNNNLILNVNGETYNLNTSDQQSLYETIYAALQKLGIK